MATTAAHAIHHRWADVPPEAVSGLIARRYVNGERMTVARLDVKRGGRARPHAHESEEMLCVLSGAMKVTIEGEQTTVRAGEMMQIPGGLPHAIEALEDTALLDIFSPIRQDWLDKTDTYFER